MRVFGMCERVSDGLVRVMPLLVLPMAALFFLPSRAVFAERYVFEHEFVLGTSLQIQVDAETSAAAADAETRVLAEIDRLAAIFSSYDAGSEFSRWQATLAEPVAVSPELLRVLAASDRWRELSHGAFNPSSRTASNLWKQAGQNAHTPTAEELAAAVRQMQSPQWSLDPASGTATRLSSGPLTLDAIAKGTILDAAASAGLSSRTSRGNNVVRGVIVNIGGDLKVAGDLVTPVQITNPLADAVNAAPLCSIYVHNQGIATSGGYRRGFDVAGKRASHILDPRTAQPVDHLASVTVVAADAETADALATTFSVLSIEETKTLAGSLQDVEFLLVTRDGQQISSQGWAELQQPKLFRLTDATQVAKPSQPAAFAAVAAEKPLELVVDFELASDTGARYRRPYVAVWLEDADGYPVKTAVLWMTTRQPGPRWHRDLLRWYRKDRTRKVADQKDLIGVISEATRGPGQYKAVFDGTDDAGDALPPGKYTLFIEVAREHGTYQIISHPVELGSKPVARTKLKSNAEIKSAAVEYREPTTTDGK